MQIKYDSLYVCKEPKDRSKNRQERRSESWLLLILVSPSTNLLDVSFPQFKCQTSISRYRYNERNSTEKGVLIFSLRVLILFSVSFLCIFQYLFFFFFFSLFNLFSIFCFVSLFSVFFVLLFPFIKQDLELQRGVCICVL